MKTGKFEIIALMVLVLSFSFALPAKAQKESDVRAGENVKSEAIGKKHQPERRETWRRMPQSLMGKILLWEHYVIANRKHLSLDDKQLDAIGFAQNEQRRYRIRKWAERRVALLEIEQLLVTEPVDLTKVGEKAKAVAAISADVTIHEVQTLEKVLSILTPEQRKHVETFMRESTFLGGFETYRRPRSK